MKKVFISLGLIALLGLRDSAVQRPNVLFIMVDDLRPELASFGATHIVSPNIDKLVSESATFERAYCNVPVCGASRASLMSGVRPGRFRFTSAETMLQEHYPNAKSMPALFHENGYETISNGKIYHNPTDDKNAWDEIWRAKVQVPFDYISPSNVALAKMKDTRGMAYENEIADDTAYADGKTAQKTINDLNKLKQSNKPFFLAVGFLKPHLPFNAPKKYWDLYDYSKIALPNNYSQPQTTPSQAYHSSGELRNYTGIPKKGFVSDSLARQLIHGYYACVSYTDVQIGKILRELERLGLDKNTIVVLVGDHGWNLGDHKMWNKHCNFSSSLRTPLIIKIPKLTHGQRYNKVVEFIDVFPTMAELARLTLPKTTNGESLIKIIEGRKRHKNFAISKWNNGLTLIQGPFYYTEWIDQNDKIVARMLFDHSTDPLENNNLAEDVKYKPIVTEMSKQISANRGEDFNLDRR